MRELRFKGALINGHSNGVYLDDARYLPFWERVAALAVPIYLHPVHMPVRPPVFDDYPGLAASMWGWTAETGAHALRLVLERAVRSLSPAQHHPRPYGRGAAVRALAHRQPVQDLPAQGRAGGAPIPIHPPQFLRDHTPAPARARRCALRHCKPSALIDIMFSVDYPLEDSAEAARFIETAPIGEQERAMICWRNAAQLLRL